MNIDVSMKPSHLLLENLHQTSSYVYSSYVLFEGKGGKKAKNKVSL